MMEVQKDYASKGVAGAGLGLGIAGTALGLLGNNVLPGLFNGGAAGNCGCNPCNTGCSDNMPVNRYELAQEQKISELQAAIALRDANTYNDQKLLELYKYVDGKFEGVNAAINQQAVYNATNNATLNCMSGQIAQLFSLTKLVVPNGSVCPGWGTVTVTPAGASTTG